MVLDLAHAHFWKKLVFKAVVLSANILPELPHSCSHRIEFSSVGIFEYPFTRVECLSEAGDAIRVDFVVLVLEIGRDGEMLDAPWVLHADPVASMQKRTSMS